MECSSAVKGGRKVLVRGCPFTAPLPIASQRGKWEGERMALRLMGLSYIPKVSRCLFFMSAPSGPNYGFSHKTT